MHQKHPRPQVHRDIVGGLTASSSQLMNISNTSTKREGGVLSAISEFQAVATSTDLKESVTKKSFYLNFIEYALQIFSGLVENSDNTSLFLFSVNKS